MNLLKLWNSIESYLFPALGKDLDEKLSNKEQEFVRVCTLAELDRYVYRLEWRGVGRRSRDWLSILKAFVAKSVYNIHTTRAFIEYLYAAPVLRRLCGWEKKNQIPHESKFSRVLDQIAELDLTQKIHDGMIVKHCGERIVGHVSRNSTAIKAREQSVKTKRAPKQSDRKNAGGLRKARSVPRSKPKLKSKTAERVNSNLEDNYGGSTVRVRGNKKVMAHLMFGVISVAANQIFNLIC